MASFAPVTGRLCQIYSPRACIIVVNFIFAIGALVTAAAPTFTSFLLGRSISGIGAAGVSATSINLVLQLTAVERRGLFIGLVNTGYTIGVSLGSVVAGALLPTIGWVCSFKSRTFCVAKAPDNSIRGQSSGYRLPWHS